MSVFVFEIQFNLIYNMKIISLNIRRYYEWASRKNNIYNIIKELDPDIILLQETIFDENYSKINQVQEIAEKIWYKNFAFSSTWIKFSQRWVILDKPIQIWQWVISKYAILEIENLFLNKEYEDKENRLLQNFSIELDWNKYLFSNIHFSNSDLFAEKHLIQTLNLFENRNEERIICWDFNIKKLSNYKKHYENTYNSSNDLYDYITYENKNEVLDYVLLPKKYEFKVFKSINNNLSDHNLLYFEI